MTNTMIEILPGTYTIDPARSGASFAAYHTIGKKPVRGEMPIRSGTVTVAAEPRRSTVSAELDAAGWRTDNPRRDKDVRGKRFLDTEKYPVIGFRSTRVVGDGGSWRVVGVLSVRGGSAEVELAITRFEPTVDGCRITATTRVDRVAAGVPSGRALIARHVDVELTVTLVA
jgi:polyisoprenoid-binding protein YceI